MRQLADDRLNPSHQNLMDLNRSSGLLLHPTSLPGSSGIGTVGEPARRFVDRLAEAGQTWWQILPLNPPGHAATPYSSPSAFAGNPLLLDLDSLVHHGWLTDDEVGDFRRHCQAHPEDRYVAGGVDTEKRTLLRKAAHRWREGGGRTDAAFRAFVEEHGDVWLDDYALFAALKRRFDGPSWRDWPDEFVRRDDEALDRARDELTDEISTVEFAQWRFFAQWGQLRDYAAERGVRFLGDLPIFVAMDSADAWANRRLFELDERGRADAVAGVPPDYFSETGQRWGNPLYDWDAMADDDYRWWIDRVAQVRSTVDLIRVDHFRGFEAYWRIPADEPTAVNGEWIDGPKDDIFEAIRGELGAVPFVAEDLGTITEDVHELRDRQKLPGMKVMHFAFGGQPDHPFLPHTYPERAVAYTGTHDNDTTRGWYEQLDDAEKHRVRTYLSCADDEVVRAMIDRLWHSSAALVVIPVQDLFELGSDARMNTPGTERGNWEWRMTDGQLNNEEVFRWLGGLTQRAGR